MAARKTKRVRPGKRTGPSGGAAGAARARPALTSRAAILALVLCAITLSLAYPLREYIAQRSEIAQLRETRAELEDSVDELEERKEQLEDPAHIEREARTRLHYQYPDEYAYVVLDSGDDDAGTGAEEAASTETWFARLWRSVGAADTSSTPPDEVPDARPLPR